VRSNKADYFWGLFLGFIAGIISPEIISGFISGVIF
jgi:MFS superfamily sulfate permease-like transporter